MVAAETAPADYLLEIRSRVCSRCVDRPPGGPPCAPLGKKCGVEMHMSALIDSVGQVHNKLLGPYQDHDRQAICEKCALLNSSFCPCPMEYLAELIVEAVEVVDERRECEPGLAREANPKVIHLPMEPMDCVLCG
jgi:hypothetical protein